MALHMVLPSIASFLPSSRRASSHDTATGTDTGGWPLPGFEIPYRVTGTVSRKAPVGVPVESPVIAPFEVESRVIARCHFSAAEDGPRMWTATPARHGACIARQRPRRHPWRRSRPL